LRDLSALLSVCDDARGPLAELRTLLSQREREALRRRAEYLLKTGSFPQATSYRAMPWPAI